MSSSSLPQVPHSVEDANGHPYFGTYQGELHEVALSRLKGPYALPLPLRVLKHKRWSYAQVVTPEIIAVCAVADLTYTSNAFVTAVDLRSRKVSFDEGFLGVPGTRVHVSDSPGEGLDASFKRPGTRFEMRRAKAQAQYRIDVELGSPLPLMDGVMGGLRMSQQKLQTAVGTGLLLKGARALGFDGGFRLNAEFETQGSAPALTVVSPVGEDGVINVTQKRAGLAAHGSLRIGDRVYSLDGGVAGLDYTHGYLARHTAWRWAMGNGRLPDGALFGFNLVEGFNESNPRCNENALWVGDRLLPLGRAKFAFDKDAPEKPWEVTTADGVVALKFEPLHLHREERDYKVVKSHFVQPLGVFSGTLRIDGRHVELKDVGGVTEDQDILW